MSETHPARADSERRQLSIFDLGLERPAERWRALQAAEERPPAWLDPTLHETYPLTLLSAGGGQDSSLLLYLAHHDPAYRARYVRGHLVVVHADPGDNTAATAEHLAHTARWCAERGIEFHHLTPSMGFHSEKWPGLVEFYRRTGTIGSVAFKRVCTDQLKIKPQQRFVQHWLAARYGVEPSWRGVKDVVRAHGRIRWLIGIAGDEEERAFGEVRERWARECFVRSYPLLEMGLGRAEVQRRTLALGECLGRPSACRRCHYQSPRELLLLARTDPDGFEEWVQLEQAKLDKFAEQCARTGTPNLGVYGTVTLRAKLAEAERDFGHLSTAELEAYAFSRGHCVASRY